MDNKTITKQRDHHLRNSKVRQLQQRWQELKERELRAQQHNKELLQQFEKAQDSVKEMLACTAAMKTLRMEYERYLKENPPHWQQQLKEKTQAAQRMRMEANLRSCLRNTKEAEDTKVYAGSDKKTQHIAETQDKDSCIYPDYNQDSSPYHPCVQASWPSHPPSQTAGFPMSVCPQPQSSSQVPPSFLSHHHPFMLQHVSSTPSHHLWHEENAPAWSSLQTDRPWSAGASGLPDALWGPLYSKDPPSELMASRTVAQGPETSRASGSKSERCGGRRTDHLSQELDIKPVRLSSSHAETSESDKDSRTVRDRKKQKRGRSHRTSSEKESHSSESSRTSSAVIIPSAAVVQSSESDAFSGKCKSKKRRQRSGAQVAESLRTVQKDKNSNGGDESAGQGVSGRQTEESTAENSSADDKSDVCREESGRNSIQLTSKAGDEKQKQEIISSEQSSSEEKDDDYDHEKDLGDENNTEENSPHGDVEDEDDDDPEEKDRCIKEEAKDELKHDDRDKRSSASSQDEDDDSEQDETDEERSDEEEQGERGEEQRSDKEGGEESDSEDSVISSVENRKHIIPEEADDDDDDDDNKTGFSDGDDSNDLSEEDDIENLLAPQEQIQKREGKDLKTAEKPKVSDTKIVQVEADRSTKITPQHSDSDEFDHFYD